jgi:hydrogenase maturation protein HypF
MLPYTPLHHLLLEELGFAVVASSGNRGDEPIVTDEGEAREKLGRIADFFLVHDRPIRNAVDDSVVRVMGGREVVLRRARGYAPLPIVCAAVTAPVLALGGQQKSAVATGHAGQLFLGPHIGELGSAGARAAFARQAGDLPRLHGIAPARVAADRHPDYVSTRMAEQFGLPVARVPHHLAHVLGGMIDNALTGKVLGVAWDGTGYGGDGTIWGGEFLAVDEKCFRRAASLHPFRLPGGEAAVREPRRSALGVLHAIFGEDAPATDAFTPAERAVLATMLRRGVHAPLTSSAGRLFDAVASLLDLCQVASFEGEAAMAVECAAGRARASADLPEAIVREEGGLLLLDWRPMVAGLVEARARGEAREALAAALHEALAASIVEIARRVDRERVVLSGGCFQNARLTELTIERLREAGFVAFWHRRIPPNDGGLAAGQAIFAARPLIEEKG